MLPLPEITRRLHGWAPGPLPPVPDGKRWACRRRQARRGRFAAGARRPAARAVSRVRRFCCCLPSSFPGAHGLKDRVTKNSGKDAWY
ncbi:hypothetical protein Bca101_043568 [Brassica carinata]